MRTLFPATQWLLTFTFLAALAQSSISAEVNPTLAREAKSSLRRGAQYLLDKQQDDGSWQNDPALTALACIALHQSHAANLEKKIKAAVAKGRGFMSRFIRDDGSISMVDEKGVPVYVNYTTAICLCALATINDPEDQQAIRAGRRFLIDLQLDEDNKTHPTKPDNPFYGGIGYGSGGPTRPDLSNTQWALEALYITQHLDEDDPKATDEDRKKSAQTWKNAVQFMKHVQNVPLDAGPTWVVSGKNPDMDGGFIYKPGDSKVNSKLEKQGKEVPESLRSYGSMTYAGLKSMIYAKLGKDDARVKAARDWASKHYTFDENPGMGPEGHFYYLQTMAKALQALDSDSITTADGQTRNWRDDILKACLKMQGQDGEWVNHKSGRWRESDPQLVTAYAMITMEVALGDQR